MTKIKYFFKSVSLSLLLIHFFANFSNAQDGKISIDLDRDETVGNAFFVKNNGLWLIASTNTMAKDAATNKYITNDRLIKFNADLSKQEWTVDGLKNIDVNPMFDPKFPDYIYFRHVSIGGGLLFGKDKYYQINKTGKLRTYEEQKEREKDVDECAGAFTSMGYFGEIWTKKKSKNEFVLILHDHEKFKLTKKTISFTERKDKKKFREWFLGGAIDNKLIIFRHEENIKSFLIQVLVIDIKLGKVINEFDFTPKLKSKNNYVSVTTDNRSTNGMSLKSNDSERENGYGCISLSENGNSIYHYGITTDEAIEKSDVINALNLDGTPKGFALTKLGLDGKEIFNQETLLKNKEIGEELQKGYKSLIFKEQNDKKVQLELVIVRPVLAKTNIERYAMLFDNTTGNQVDHCLRGVKLKTKIAQKSKASVKSIDDLLPCFQKKNNERISKYIAGKQIDGLYNVYEDGESQVLSIHIVKEQNLGLIYFKE